MSPIHQDRSADTAVEVMATLPPPGAAESSGVATGYSPGRTLRFGVELRRQLKRRRTQLTLGFMVLLPILYSRFALPKAKAEATAPANADAGGAKPVPAE